jgi:transketolase
MPWWELFEGQNATYRDSVLPPAVTAPTIEEGAPPGWQRYAGLAGATLWAALGTRSSQVGIDEGGCWAFRLYH